MESPEKRERRKLLKLPVHECPWTSPRNTSSTCGILEESCSETEVVRQVLFATDFFRARWNKSRQKALFGVLCSTTKLLSGSSQVHDVPRQKPAPPHCGDSIYLYFVIVKLTCFYFHNSLCTLLFFSEEHSDWLYSICPETHKLLLLLLSVAVMPDLPCPH